MYDIKNKQYILKTSNGRVWNIFYDDKLGLCYSILTKRNTWADPISLKKDVHQCFYCDIDREDKIHIVFQDYHGNIFYSSIFDNKIDSTPILNSKSQSSYDKHLHLMPLKNSIHFFYVLRHNNASILSHQTIINGKVSTPRAIDYVTADDHPFSVVCDTAENIFVFYQVSDGRIQQLGYKRYTASSQNWNEITQVTSARGDCEFPKVITDSNNIIHLCYQKRVDRKFQLVYIQKIPDKNIWTNEAVVHTSELSFNNMSLVNINGRLYVYWVREYSIYFCALNENSPEWTKPAKYNFVSSKQLMCMVYRTNSLGEYGKIYSTDIPGAFINGLKLGFYQEAAESSNEFSASDLKNFLVGEIKLLRNTIDEIKEMCEKLQDEVFTLKTANQNFERELTKASLEIKMYENDFKQAKSLNSTLKGHIDLIEDLKSRSSEHEQIDISELKSQIANELLSESSSLKDIQYIKEEIQNLKQAQNQNNPSGVIDADYHELQEY